MSNYLFNKRFASGDQNIHIDKSTHKIVENEIQYYWCQNAIYNKIGPLVDLFKSQSVEFTSEEEKKIIYGKNGLVEQLIPLQIAYNNVMNRRAEYANRISTGTIFVEDGSVDADDLAEEGLAPGKIIIYRQGTEAPEVERIDPHKMTSLNEYIYDLERQIEETYHLFAEKYKKKEVKE